MLQTRKLLDRDSFKSFAFGRFLVSLGYIVCNMGKQPYGCLHLAPTFNDTFKRSAFAPFLVSLGYIACNAGEQPYGCLHIATTFNDSYKDSYFLHALRLDSVISRKTMTF